MQNAAARLVTGTRRRDHITPVLRQLHWLPVRQRVEFKLALKVYKALHDATAAYLVDDCLSLTSDVAGSDRLTSTRAAFHGPTHGSAIGALQLLDHSSGTICRPRFASPTMTSENFDGSQSRFCLIDNAAHSDYFALMRLLNTLTHSLTHQEFWSILSSWGELSCSWSMCVIRLINLAYYCCAKRYFRPRSFRIVGSLVPTMPLRFSRHSPHVLPYQPKNRSRTLAYFTLITCKLLIITWHLH